MSLLKHARGSWRLVVSNAVALGPDEYLLSVRLRVALGAEWDVDCPNILEVEYVSMEGNGYELKAEIL